MCIRDSNQSGLRRQHLCGVLATAEICGAKLEGAELGSEDLLFIPKKIKAGTYQFAVGTGGSVSLVLQSVLLPLAVQKHRAVHAVVQLMAISPGLSRT